MNPSNLQLRVSGMRRLVAHDASHPHIEPRLVCPRFPVHRGPHRYAYPMHVTVGLPPADFVQTDDLVPLVGERVVDLFDAAGVSGFRAQPVLARFRSPRAGGEPAPLWELQITGWGGAVSPATGLPFDMACPACGRVVWKGDGEFEHLVDPAFWDGSDLFKVWPLSHIWATGRVVELIKRAKLRGLNVRALSADGLGTIRNTLRAAALHVGIAGSISLSLEQDRARLVEQQLFG